MNNDRDHECLQYGSMSMIIIVIVRANSNFGTKNPTHSKQLERGGGAVSCCGVMVGLSSFSVDWTLRCMARHAYRQPIQELKLGYTESFINFSIHKSECPCTHNKHSSSVKFHSTF